MEPYSFFRQYPKIHYVKAPTNYPSTVEGILSDCFFQPLFDFTPFITEKVNEKMLLDILNNVFSYWFCPNAQEYWELDKAEIKFTSLPKNKSEQSRQEAFIKLMELAEHSKHINIRNTLYFLLDKYYAFYLFVKDQEDLHLLNNYLLLSDPIIDSGKSIATIAQEEFYKAWYRTKKPKYSYLLLVDMAYRNGTVERNYFYKEYLRYSANRFDGMYRDNKMFEALYPVKLVEDSKGIIMVAVLPYKLLTHLHSAVVLLLYMDQQLGHSNRIQFTAQNPEIPSTVLENSMGIGDTAEISVARGIKLEDSDYFGFSLFCIGINGYKYIDKITSCLLDTEEKRRLFTKSLDNLEQKISPKRYSTNLLYQLVALQVRCNILRNLQALSLIQDKCDIVVDTSDDFYPFSRGLQWSFNDTMTMFFGIRDIISDIFRDKKLVDVDSSIDMSLFATMQWEIYMHLMGKYSRYGDKFPHTKHNLIFFLTRYLTKEGLFLIMPFAPFAKRMPWDTNAYDYPFPSYHYRYSDSKKQYEYKKGRSVLSLEFTSHQQEFYNRIMGLLEENQTLMQFMVELYQQSTDKSIPFIILTVLRKFSSESLDIMEFLDIIKQTVGENTVKTLLEDYSQSYQVYGNAFVRHVLEEDFRDPNYPFYAHDNEWILIGVNDYKYVEQYIVDHTSDEQKTKKQRIEMHINGHIDKYLMRGEDFDKRKLYNQQFWNQYLSEHKSSVTTRVPQYEEFREQVLGKSMTGKNDLMARIIAYFLERSYALKDIRARLTDELVQAVVDKKPKAGELLYGSIVGSLEPAEISAGLSSKELELVETLRKDFVGTFTALYAYRFGSRTDKDNIKFIGDYDTVFGFMVTDKAVSLNDLMGKIRNAVVENKTLHSDSFVAFDKAIGKTGSRDKKNYVGSLWAPFVTDRNDDGFWKRANDVYNALKRQLVVKEERVHEVIKGEEAETKKVKLVEKPVEDDLLADISLSITYENPHKINGYVSAIYNKKLVELVAQIKTGVVEEKVGFRIYCQLLIKVQLIALHEYYEYLSLMQPTGLSVGSYYTFYYNELARSKDNVLGDSNKYMEVVRKIAMEILDIKGIYEKNKYKVKEYLL